MTAWLCWSSTTKGQPPRTTPAHHRGHRRADRHPAATRPRPAPDEPGRRAETAPPRIGATPMAAPPSPRSAWRSATASGLPRVPTLHTVDGADFDRHRVVLYAYRHSYAQRHAGCRRPHRRAARPDGPPQARHHQGLLPRRRASPTRGRGTRRQARLRPARQPHLVAGTGAARLRAQPAIPRRGRSPVRGVHRAVQRQSRRRCLPVPVPVRRLRPLPHRRILPARSPRLPR